MKKLLNKKILGILISIIFIAVIIYHIDLNKAIDSFKLMNPILILPVIPVYFLSFIFRTFRWKIFLSEKDLKFSSLLSSIFIGFSLNCILPARAGEIYRAYFFSKKEKLNKTKVFTSVVLERFFDGFLLFIILITVVCLVNSSELFFKIAFSAGVIFLGGFISLLTLVKLKDSGNKREKIKLFIIKNASKYENLINKAFSMLDSFFEGLKILNSYKLLFCSLFLTFLIWLMEGSSTYFVIKSFGIDISYIGAFLVLTVTAFSSLIPAGPAGIGPFQWGYIIALASFNVEKELGFAVSVVNQFVLIAIILCAGIFFAWKDLIKINKKELEEELNWS